MKRPKGVLLDLDGTVWDDNVQPYPGAAEAIGSIREGGLPVLFATNTTRLTRAALAQRLVERGVQAEPSQIITATQAGVIWLREQGLRRIAVFVPDRALPEFDEFELVDEDPDALIVGDLGKGWSFDVMNRIFRLLLVGPEFLTLQRNKYWKTGGELVLDAGAFVAAFEYATGRQARLVGKPGPIQFEAAAHAVGCEPRDLVMVGDSLETDIEGGLDAGCTSVLVRTGKFSAAELAGSAVQPDAVIDSVADLPKALDAFA
jgi:HAD superfamily hydrolase (TIGR01458 family)